MKDVFRSGDSSKKFKIAEGQWYRYAPSYVSPAYHLLEGFPFMQEPPSGDLQERVLILHHFFFSSRRRHTMCSRDWSSDVCSSDLLLLLLAALTRSARRVKAANKSSNARDKSGKQEQRRQPGQMVNRNRFASRVKPKIRRSAKSARSEERRVGKGRREASRRERDRV